MDKVWMKIDDILLQPDIYSTVEVDLSELSPLAPDIVQIPMVGQIDNAKFIENIARNFLKQELKLKCATWQLIKDIYEAVKMDTHLQMFLDILLIVSKIQVEEYCRYYKKDHHSTLSKEQYFEQKFLVKVLTEVKNRLIKRDIILADENMMNVIKQILVQPSVMSAFEDGLNKLGLDNDKDRIENYIYNMQIYFSKSLGNEIQGLTLRSGILVSIFYADFFGIEFRESVEKALFSTDTMLLKAWILTKCCHETAHFLARSFSNDFDFSSPKFCCDKDPHDEIKLFEFGRYIELRLFETQPNWVQSSEQAAVDFINNVLIKNELPLIRPKEDDFNYLVARDQPSLSFAGDIELIHTDGFMC